MAHDYNYRVDGTALVPTYAKHVRLLEGVAGVRADQLDIAYRHGVYVADRHWSKSRLMRMDTVLVDGTASQIYTGLQGLYGQLLGGIKTLRRNDPAQGEVQCEILVADPVEQPDGPQRVQWRWPVWQLRGYWEDFTASTDTDLALGTTGTVGALSVGGTHPTEPKFTITCQTAGANPALEDQTTGDKLLLAGSFSASDVIVVDVAERTVTLNGSQALNILTINRGWWMEWAAGATVTLDWTADSGSWDVTTEWRDRHR